MTAEECPLTELPPEQCACPSHRGGTAPGEEPVETVGQPFEAQFPGVCARGDRIEPGQRIVRVADDEGYAHADRCRP